VRGGGRPLFSAAPAKLNLYLHITGRREDGYHELDSLIAFAEPCDWVAVEPAADFLLAPTGPFAGALDTPHDDNLVVRAGRGLAALAGIEPAARLYLEKNLPVASGIGGGSSDAAAALRGLMCLWDIMPESDALAELALSLGADVPVCLHGETCFVGGIGERLDPAPKLPNCGLVLVNPGVALATPEVFRARTGSFTAPARFTEVPADATALARFLAARRNDLEAPALALAPAIGEVLHALRDLPGCRFARMSGSGATCFALFDDNARAVAAAGLLRTHHGNWWIEPGRFHHSDSGGSWRTPST